MLAELRRLKLPVFLKVKAMISAKEARKKAEKFKVPAPGEFIKIPSVEVLHFFLLQNNLEVAGWRGDYLTVRKVCVVEAQSQVKE